MENDVLTEPSHDHFPPVALKHTPYRGKKQLFSFMMGKGAVLLLTHLK